jgi:RHS repeat-associated protein
VFTQGNYINYLYDNIGQLTNAAGAESGGTPIRLHEQFTYGYDKGHNLNARTNNALTNTFNVNPPNELTTVTRTGTLTVAGTTSSQATSVLVNGGSATLYNDATFAKSGMTVTNGNNTFTAVAIDSLNRQDTNSVSVNLPSTVTYQYDGNGNLTNDGLRSFQYDPENQLTNVYVTGVWRSAFKYDGFGRRRERMEFTWNSSSWVQTNDVLYIYDGMTVVQERDGNNLPRVTYTRGNDLSGTWQQAGGIGGLLARTDNTLPATLSQMAHAYYHYDGNGNVTCLVNASNAVVARYNYDPFGNTLSQSGPLADANLYRFSSKEYHANSGLYYYGYRFYDPHLQRWINRDPIGEAGGMNLYVFVGNNGLFWVDANGLHWTDYIPSFLTDPGTVNFSAGMGDVLSFNLTKHFRNHFNYDDMVDPCSGAYTAGKWTGIAESAAMGFGRIAYAGAAKAGSIMLAQEGATAANAAEAIALRNALKTGFNLGMANKDKIMTMGKAMVKYAGDYGEIIKASGRTSAGWNALGAAAEYGAVKGMVSKPCR